MSAILLQYLDNTARLKASRHRDTGSILFPEIPANFPVSDEYETIELSSSGKIYSFTIVHPGPKTGKPPFCIGYADLPEGVRVMGRIVGEAKPRVGALVTIEVAEAAEDAAPTYRFVQQA